MNKYLLSCLIIVTIYGRPLMAEESMTLKLSVAAGKSDRRGTPVSTQVRIPAGWAFEAVPVMKNAAGKQVPSQLIRPALLAEVPIGTADKTDFELWWIVDQLKAGDTAEYTVTLKPGKVSSSSFTWQDTKGKHLDLERDGSKVIRYMYQAYENHPDKRDLNNKPFHHMFAPANGKLLVTKGSGGNYTHHQGLFYGFTRCTFEGGKCNTWYCHDGEFQLHRETLNQAAGPVIARHQTQIDWNDTQGVPFCQETREVTVFAVSGGTLLEWSSRLKSVKGTITLDGDAQHAGFQFRAADEVAASTKKQTYYLRPDGQAAPGTTRNPKRGEEKPDTKDPGTKQVMNLPWNVMSFVIGGKRYSAQYIDHPDNPKPSYYSERDYGRFGSWFGKQELKQDSKPIEIRYRIWLQDGEMTAAIANTYAQDFQSAPIVTVK